MDLTTCLKKMELVGVLAFATVDSEGAPQIRNISAIHYETDAIYFLTARGKNFCKELQEDGRVQILCYTKYKEMIRMSGRAYAVSDDEQEKWRDMIFEEQPYLANVYPGDTREICTIFCIDKADIEYFNLGVNPIFREIYHLGDDIIEPQKGYYITDACIGCGKCLSRCPQRCIDEGKPFSIRQNNCLHCGACFENCPVQAVQRVG
ncbi:4Fe-4S binding protein [Agathobacter sp.]